MDRGLVAAALAAAVLTACGGEEEPPTPDPAETGLPALTVEQSCVQVQAVNDDIGGPGELSIPGFGDYGQSIRRVAEQSDGEIGLMLSAIADRSAEVSELTLDHDYLDRAVTEWGIDYQVIEQICLRTDAPIERYGS